MSNNPTAAGRTGPRVQVRYKKELRALRRYSWTRRACIALSVGLLLAAVWMMLGGI